MSTAHACGFSRHREDTNISCVLFDQYSLLSIVLHELAINLNMLHQTATPSNKREYHEHRSHMGES
jgi:hypothetical protein